MLNIAFHLLLTLAVLWYQRRRQYRPNPLALAFLWYAVGAALVFIETALITRRAFSGFLLQGIIVELFFVPAVYFSLRWAKRRPNSLLQPFFFFLLISLFALLAAGFFLAYADVVRGWDLTGLSFS